MLKINFKINKKKQAQHILELALIMPLFIMIFSFTFQLMAETYSKYKFSYIFTDAISRAIDNTTVFSSISEFKNYNFIDTSLKDFTKDFSVAAKGDYILLDKVKATLSALISEDRGAVTSTVTMVPTENILYLISTFEFNSARLFFNKAGKEYFYFSVPINRSFAAPSILNKTTNDIDSYFYWFYTAIEKGTLDLTAPSDDKDGETTEDNNEAGDVENNNGEENNNGDSTDNPDNEGN